MRAFALPLGLRRSAMTAAVVTVAATALFEDSRDQLAAATSATLGLPWLAMLGLSCAAALTVMHYISASLALRAAVDHRGSVTEVTQVQLAAAAANRIMPSGVGALGVNLRYLLRSGLTPGVAMSGLGVLGVVGALSDAAFGALVTGAGGDVGAPGAAGQLRRLAAHGVQAGRHAPWGLLVLAITGAVVLGVRRRQRRPGAASAEGRRPGGVRHLVSLARRPRRLSVMTLASGATTALLAIAFAVTVRAVAGPVHGTAAGALIVTYLVGSAVGGATPLPAFFGVTEAALTAGLVVAGLPAHTALVSTLVFRLVSFWAPAALGLLAAHRLRRAALL